MTIWPSKYNRKRTYCLWQTLSHYQLDTAKMRGYYKFAELCIGCKRKTYKLTMQLSSMCCFILLNDNTDQWNRYTVSVSVYFSSPEHKCSGWAIVIGLCPSSVVRCASCVVRKRFYLNTFCSETAHLILTKLYRNDPWVVPYHSCSHCSSWLHK